MAGVRLDRVVATLRLAKSLRQREGIWLVVCVFAGAQGARQADDRCHMYSRGVERLRALPGRGARGDDVVH